METIYQRKCAQYIYVVPEGLRELMSDISREVLREQPKDLYTFITTYLEALMITRENARVAAKAVSHMAEASEIITELLQRTDMSREQADKTVRIIQKAFRKHLKSKETRHEAIDKEILLQKIIKKTGVTHGEVENAVCVIQRAYRLTKLRRSKEQEDVVDWRKAFVKTMDLYRKSRVTPEEANRAATLIKAAYKGYYTRRVVRKFMKDYDVTPEEESELVLHTTDSWLIKDMPKDLPTHEEEEMKPVPIEDIEVKTDVYAETIPEEHPYLDYLQYNWEGEEEQLDSYAYDGMPSEYATATNVNDTTEINVTQINVTEANLMSEALEDDRTSQEATIQEAAPDEAAPNETALQEAAPEEATLEETAPEEVAPQEAASQEAAPQEEALQEAAQQEAAPDEATAQEAVPDEATADEVAA